MAANGIVREVLGDLDARLDHWRQTLVDLCRIPSMSAAGFPPEEVRRAAQAMAQALRDAGLEHVEALEIPGVHPYVYGDWLPRPGAPTVLLYGHHDVMPPRPRGEVALARLRAHRARRPSLRQGHRRRQGRGHGPRGRRRLVPEGGQDAPAEREVHHRGRGGDRLPEPRAPPPGI